MLLDGEKELEPMTGYTLKAMAVTRDEGECRGGQAWGQLDNRITSYSVTPAMSTRVPVYRLCPYVIAPETKQGGHVDGAFHQSGREKAITLPLILGFRRVTSTSEVLHD